MRNLISFVLIFKAFILFGRDFNILDFGAVPDGVTKCTESIQQAVDLCAASGGGRVVVPYGKYLTSTINLKSNINFHIDQGGIILGSTKRRSFGEAILVADHSENISITGMGKVDGQGFRKDFPTNSRRHKTIAFLNCRNIRVMDVTLVNSPSWVLDIRECDGVIVKGIRIYSFSNENNDGIDIEGKNIIISDCLIDCDDDAICLKSQNPDYLVENVTVTNCIIGSNCNAIKFGTSSRRGFKNITISNCIIRRPSEAANRNWGKIKGVTSDTTGISGIALEVVDGGTMDQVVISNISMIGIQTPLFIRLANREAPGTLRNVFISNIIATNESLMTSSITGIPGSYIENVSIKDIIFNCKGTGSQEDADRKVPEQEKSYPENIIFGYCLPSYGLYVRHVKNLEVINTRFNLLAPDARPAIILDDCHNTRIADFSADPPLNNQYLIRVIGSENITLSGYQSASKVDRFLLAEGSSDNIKLTGNDFRLVEHIYETDSECSSAGIIETGNLK